MNPTLKTRFNRTAVTMLAVACLASSVLFTAAGDATNAAAAGGVRYETAGGASSCVVEGTSTLHDWKMETRIFSGAIEADEGFPEVATAKATVQRLRFPLRTLKSDKAAMDNKMQEHMTITKFPNVEFNLIELKRKSPADARGAIQFDAVGTLAIYGKTLTNTMPVTIEKKDGKIIVTGSAPVKMSDYGIPKLSVYGLTVGDDLKINFNWVTAPKSKPQS